MKSLIAASLAFASLTAAAGITTTIEVELNADVYKGSGGKEISLSSLNKQLKAEGLKEFPKTQAFGMDAEKVNKDLVKRVEKAAKVLKLNMRPVFDRAYLHQFETMCYRGNVEDVPTVMRVMLDNVLHADQGINGIRYDESKFIRYMSEFFETNKERRQDNIDNGNEAEMKLWDKYDTKSDTVLVISDLGPQGDGAEMYATEIKPCKK